MSDEQTNREILGKAKTVRELLKGVKYTIDYYQREYKWQVKQMTELVEDLTEKFQEAFDPNHERTRVARYPHYFLGSIIISRKGASNFIVDGQQRLTSLTLLLIYLRKLQKGKSDQVNVDELIFSEKYGKKSFNMDVDERTACMEALFDDRLYDTTNQSESVKNITQRYADIDDCFSEDLRDEALPYFIDWLLENVHLVEITAYSDDDAYTIFETMNDRGLSLSPTDMLKGYLLASITDNDRRNKVNQAWRERIHLLNEAGKEVEPDFFKAWLRSQYASKIRERKKGAKAEDFDRIGTEFHRWLRDASDSIDLKKSDDFCRFIERDFDFYSKQYLLLAKASQSIVNGLDHVLYNSQNGFTLQYMLLLSPLAPKDDDNTVRVKMRLVARFVDILLTWRLWNSRSIAYNTLQYAMFVVMRDIRRLSPEDLALHLYESLSHEQETFAGNDRLFLHQQNRRYIHRILARITDYIETQSGNPSHYLDYVSDNGRNRFEIEHIWANKPERHTDEFPQQLDFAEYRNRIGDLLLLPKSPNASYGDLPYVEKLTYYSSQNLLARSLHPVCYEHNPGFVGFVNRSGLLFRALNQFKRAELDERQALYRQIAERIWNPEDLLREIGQ